MSNYDMNRRELQLVLATVLVVGTIALVGSYVVVKGFDDDLAIEIVKEAKTLLVMGVGAALAIFGLGRTVTDDKPVQ
jgi:hypothetical protein